MVRRPAKCEKEADDTSIIPTGTEKADLIRAFQKAQGGYPCFGRSGGRCSQTDCAVIQDCLAETKDEFDLNAWLLPTLDLERDEPDIHEETGVGDESRGSTRYAWIGAGQCGGRLVKSFYDLGYKTVLAVNTTRRDLDLLDIPRSQKFLMEIGEEEGTARDMEKATKVVQQHQQDILHLARQTFGSQVDRIMVCFGAGGGAGGGSAIELIEIAKRYARSIGLKDPSKNVGVVMTLPASGRVGSPLVVQNAYKVATELSQMATAGEISPLVVVDNDKINQMYPGMPIKSFWSGINNTVANLFAVFNRFSSLSSPYTCFDPADYGSIMDAGGCLIMGLTKVDRLDDRLAISKAVENNLQKTLFAGAEDLSTAKAGGCVVIGGNELMTYVRGLQDNIDYAFDVLSQITGQATIHRGIYEDNRDCLRVYTIIGGLNCPTARLKEMSTDLYYQPDVVDIEALPLHQRKEDILPLAEYFLAQQAKFHGGPDKTLSSDAKSLLLNYPWPGNVHELANVIKRAYDMTIGPEIQPDALSFEIVFADGEPDPKRKLPAIDKARMRVVDKACDDFLERLI
jgi:cell division GTPase FtsZ